MSRSFWALSTLLCAGLLSSCGPSPKQRLAVELAAVPAAGRFVVHGNCFAGWYLNLPLRIRGQNASWVSLEWIVVRVEDRRTGALLGEETIGFGIDLQEATAGRPDRSLDLPVSVRITGEPGAPAIGPVVISGQVRGHDPDGALRIPFRLEAVPTVEEVPVPNGGACSAPP